MSNTTAIVLPIAGALAIFMHEIIAPRVSVVCFFLYQDEPVLITLGVGFVITS
jgi:hypothetical protein